MADLNMKINYANGDTFYADATAGTGSGVNAIGTQINTNTAKFNVSTGHDHDGTDSSKLDWDLVWSDAVHTHASNAEGGLLTWANIFASTGAGTHTHASTTTGGTLDWDTCWADAVHSHASDAEGGATLGAITTGAINAVGNITGYDVASAGSDAYDLGTSSNHWAYIYANNIRTDWNIQPITNLTGNLGTSSYKWDDIYVQTVNQGDFVFSEKECVVCKQQFKEGEAIIDYVLSNTEEGTRCVPAHLTCCLNQTEKQRTDKHKEAIQYLKDVGRYIDPIEKRARKLREEQEREKRKLK